MLDRRGEDRIGDKQRSRKTIMRNEKIGEDKKRISITREPSKIQ